MSGSSAVGRNYPDLIDSGTDWFAQANADGFKIYDSDLAYMPASEMQELATFLNSE